MRAKFSGIPGFGGWLRGRLVVKDGSGLQIARIISVRVNAAWSGARLLLTIGVTLVAPALPRFVLNSPRLGIFLSSGRSSLLDTLLSIFTVHRLGLMVF